MPYPDRGGDKSRQPLNVVRGGSVCQPGGPGGHVLRGTMSPAVCMPTVGADTRPRWRDVANLNAHRVSRHSTAWAQHRGTKKTQQGMNQV